KNSSTIITRNRAADATHSATVARLRPGMRPSSRTGIIRALAGNRDIMRMALSQARAGDADEARARSQCFEIRRPDITHRSPKPSGKLVQYACNRSLVWHLPFNAFG